MDRPSAKTRTDPGEDASFTCEAVDAARKDGLLRLGSQTARGVPALSGRNLNAGGTKKKGGVAGRVSRGGAGKRKPRSIWSFGSGTGSDESSVGGLGVPRKKKKKKKKKKRKTASI